MRHRLPTALATLLLATPALAQTTGLGGLTLPAQLERDDWQPVFVRPADGRTVHHPTYVHPIELRRDAESPLAAETPEARLAAALDGAEPMHYAPLNVYDTAMGYGWFIADAATLVPRLVVQPPLEPVTTPPGVSEASWGFLFPELVDVEGGDVMVAPALPGELSK